MQSRRSGLSASASQLRSSQQGKILKALERQENSALADTEAKWGKDARTAMGDYFAMQEESKQRKRAKDLAMPLHLRCGPNPVDMGCPIRYLTATQDANDGPIKMAVDPKWSTDLKKINNKVGMQIQYEAKLSACIGGLSPELPFMQPKKHLSNPPSPFYKPGALDRHRTRPAE